MKLHPEIDRVKAWKVVCRDSGLRLNTEEDEPEEAYLKLFNELYLLQNRPLMGKEAKKILYKLSGKHFRVSSSDKFRKFVRRRYFRGGRLSYELGRTGNLSLINRFLGLSMINEREISQGWAFEGYKATLISERTIIPLICGYIEGNHLEEIKLVIPKMNDRQRNYFHLLSSISISEEMADYLVEEKLITPSQAFQKSLHDLDRLAKLLVRYPIELVDELKVAIEKGSRNFDNLLAFMKERSYSKACEEIINLQFIEVVQKKGYYVISKLLKSGYVKQETINQAIPFFDPIMKNLIENYLSKRK